MECYILQYIDWFLEFKTISLSHTNNSFSSDQKSNDTDPYKFSFSFKCEKRNINIIRLLREMNHTMHESWVETCSFSFDSLSHSC